MHINSILLTQYQSAFNISSRNYRLTTRLSNSGIHYFFFMCDSAQAYQFINHTFRQVYSTQHQYRSNLVTRMTLACKSPITTVIQGEQLDWENVYIILFSPHSNIWTIQSKWITQIHLLSPPYSPSLSTFFGRTMVNKIKLGQPDYELNA